MKKLYCFAVCMIVLLGAMVFVKTGTHGQQAVTSVSQMVTPQLSGNGVPSATYACDVRMANVSYLQLDSTNGRIWLCDQSTGSWAWEHLLSPIAAATTPIMTTGGLLAGACTSITTINMASAVFGTNAVTVSPIYSTPPTAPGLLNLTGWVSANGVVSVQACALGSISSTTFTARVLLY